MPIIPSISVAIQDEAVLQGYVGSLNFAGAGVTAAVVGDVATVTIAGGGSITSPIQGDYLVGNTTIPTGKFALQGKRLEMISTNRMTLEGTARLIISG